MNEKCHLILLLVPCQPVRSILVTQEYPGHAQQYPGHTEQCSADTKQYSGHTQQYPGQTQKYPGHTEQCPADKQQYPADTHLYHVSSTSALLSLNQPHPVSCSHTVVSWQHAAVFWLWFLSRNSVTARRTRLRCTFNSFIPAAESPRTLVPVFH